MSIGMTLVIIVATMCATLITLYAIYAFTEGKKNDKKEDRTDNV